MKLPFCSHPFIVILGFTGLAVADTFTLKDGKVLEGKILRTEGNVYVIEYQVTPSIKDIRKVPKAEVVKIVTEKLDEKAFVAIAKLVPTPDLLTADGYKQRLLEVKAFVTKYPKSAKLKAAEAVAKQLTEEAAEVEAGGRKLQGLMIKGADYRANAFDLDARVLEAKIRDAAKKSQWLAALRAFAELDKEYQAAACYREVLPVVVKSLQTFRAQVFASLSTFDARMEKQAADLEKMAPEDRANSTRELAAQAAELEAKYQLEKSSGQPWVTPHPSHKQSMEDDHTLAESELQRLTTPPPAADGGRVFRNAWKLLRSDADADAVEKALAEAQAAALPERYLKLLQDAAKASGKQPGGEE
ncbi:MAG: hypothetical protein NTW21_18840 [Verrucomicrobia bacterium]|nr:hypothetical protein [Verrucomicrobiota bacterium]